jgi:hypothetical protein
VRWFRGWGRAFRSTAGFSTPETAVIVTALSLLSATVPGVGKYVDTIRAATSANGAATLSVAVTVVRSCSVDAQLGSGSLVSVRMTCSPGAADHVRVGESLMNPTGQKGARHINTDVEVDQGNTEQARVITINF